MFRIGDFSKLTRVSVRMLRYYDEMNLFRPFYVDDFTGYRYYSASQIPKLNVIVSLRDMGFNVSDIISALSAGSDDILKKMLFDKKNEILLNIKNEKNRLIKIDSSIKNLKKERVNMNYNVTLKSVPSYKVISLKGTIPSYSEEGILWKKLIEYIQKKKITCTDVSYASYFDEGYKEGEVQVEVVIGVKKLLKSEGDFIFKETEPVKKCASILVAGDYSNITPSYNFLGKWIEENGYMMCGNPRQSTIRGHWNENDTKNYLTEIQIPIK